VTDDNAARLAADLARVPAVPAGAHLDEEALFALVTDAMSGSAEAAALAHLETCPACAERAAGASAGATAARAASRRAAAVVARYAFLHVVAIAAVRVAQREDAARRRLRTRAIAWQAMSPGALSCALIDREGGPVLALRSASPDWSGIPLHYVIRDARSGAPWADGWFVAHADGDSGSGWETNVPLRAASPLPAEWDVEIARAEFNPSSPPTPAELDSLRLAVRESSARDLDAWRRWLDAAVTAGQLSDELRRSLLPA
jgi:hypothetical protein